jgi:hypothetical protein
MRSVLIFILFNAVLVVGCSAGWWSPVHALFASIIQCGIDDICTAIRQRQININWTGPIKLKHIYEEEV